MYYLARRLNGSQIKCYNDPLHHLQLKFCLVDDKVLLTGTLNWGSDRSSDHWNYVYITSKNQLVNPVKDKFNHMWSYWKNNPVGQNNTGGNETRDQNESDSEGHPSHTEDHESLAEDHLSHTEDRLSHTQEQLSNIEEHLSHIELSSTSQILSAVPSFSDCVQISQTFRETVSTPEVYIS